MERENNKNRRIELKCLGFDLVLSLKNEQEIIQQAQARMQTTQKQLAEIEKELKEIENVNNKSPK